MLISSGEISQRLQTLTAKKKLVVAFSGGRDSHVLLHLLANLSASKEAEIAFQLRAIYIDHGLQAIATHWAQHCLDVCNDLSIPCDIVRLKLMIPKGESLEAVAREARYHAFAQALQHDELLVTAHHQDDQAETLLIQLFRGAGVNGLAAMPLITPFAESQHLRPLLDQPHHAIVHYARLHNLVFIEDPSNQEQRFDRNFLRHTLLPLLKTRWKGMSKVLMRVAQHQAEAKQLLAEYLEKDLLVLVGRCEGTLSIKKLQHLSIPRRKAVIRYFIDKKGFLAPSEKKLQHILSDVLQAQPSATPCVQWQGVEIRRYQDDFYAILPLVPHNTQQIICWDVNQPLQLPSLNRILKINQLEAIDSLLKVNQTVEVRFRQGGECVYQARRKCTQRLKKIFQERQIPPWERGRIPLIYIDNQLVLILWK